MVYLVDIKSYGVLAEVCRLTANAALQRGDAAHVATSDNRELIERWIDEGKRFVEKALGRYSKGNMKYSMPYEWPNRSEEVNGMAELFLVNYALAKWFELWAEGPRYVEAANVALESIRGILNRREKPI